MSRDFFTPKAREDSSGGGNRQAVKQTDDFLTATFTGYSDMTQYFLPGLTKAQADALGRSGCGDFTLSGVSPKTLNKFLDEELLKRCGEKVIWRD
jgi:hypothetical protein